MRNADGRHVVAASHGREQAGPEAEQQSPALGGRD
jgi:hypothetical protein